MLRNKTDLIVNSTDITQYLTDYKISFNKVWGKDAGRNTISGKYTGTLIGIFPKITCTFRRLTLAEIHTLTTLLDTTTQTVQYYDPYKNQVYTMTTYCGDYELGQQCLFSDVARAGLPFTVSFIAVNKRS